MADEIVRPEAPRIRSLAVLPLQNLSRDPDQEFFSDGTTEALISNLAQIHDLDVISRTSVMRYKGTTKTVPEIGRELGVDAILEGSVQRVGSASALPCSSFARPRTNISGPVEYDVMPPTFDARGRDRRTIAQEIQAHLTPEEARRSPALDASTRTPARHSCSDATTKPKTIRRTTGRR